MTVAQNPVDVVERARSLAPLVRARAAQAESERRLPKDAVAALEESGLFGMMVPRELGGLEIGVASMVRAVEELAIADGSTAWCVMIAAETGIMAAFLPRAAADEIYGRQPFAATGGVFAPRGTAERVEGGFRLTGRWPFASGSSHCRWLEVGCAVMGADGPELMAPGIPLTRMAYFPAEDAEIIDCWHVSGLRGTASNDIVLSGLFVPEHRTVSLATDRPWAAGEVYRFPPFPLLATGIAGVALGIARGAIEELKQLAGAKTPTGQRRPLAERGMTQVAVSEAEAAVRSAQAFLYESIGRIADEVARGARVDDETKAILRLACTNATARSAEAVDRMYTLGGATAIYESNVLQRQFRDIHVVTQHLMVSAATLELTGRIFLGLATDGSQL